MEKFRTREKDRKENSKNEDQSHDCKINLNSYTVHCFPKDIDKLKKIKEEIKKN